MTIRQQWVFAFLCAGIVIVIALILSPAPEASRVTFQSCEEARELGAPLPLTPASPGWNPRLDPEGDGTAC
jgi:hypothetical protein